MKKCAIAAMMVMALCLFAACGAREDDHELPVQNQTEHPVEKTEEVSETTEAETAEVDTTEVETAEADTAEAETAEADTEIKDGSKKNPSGSAETIDVETAWQYLKEAYFDTSELNEISYDEDNKLKVVTWRGEMEFSDGEEERPCESVVFFDHQEEDAYIFGNYLVFYDGTDIYGLRTRGWYSVDAYTGEVSSR